MANDSEYQLPKDWIRVKSKRTQSWYYFNTKTGKSCWTLKEVSSSANEHSDKSTENVKLIDSTKSRISSQNRLNALREQLHRAQRIAVNKPKRKCAEIPESSVHSTSPDKLLKIQNKSHNITRAPFQRRLEALRVKLGLEQQNVHKPPVNASRITPSTSVTKDNNFKIAVHNEKTIVHHNKISKFDKNTSISNRNPDKFITDTKPSTSADTCGSDGLKRNLNKALRTEKEKSLEVKQNLKRKLIYVPDEKNKYFKNSKKLNDFHKYSAPELTATRFSVNDRLKNLRDSLASNLTDYKIPKISLNKENPDESHKPMKFHQNFNQFKDNNQNHSSEAKEINFDNSYNDNNVNNINSNVIKEKDINVFEQRLPENLPELMDYDEDNDDEEKMDWEDIPEEIILREIIHIRQIPFNEQNPDIDLTENEYKFNQSDTNINCNNSRQCYIVIDTNIFISHLKFIDEFIEKNVHVNSFTSIIFVPYIVLQELDKLKICSNSRVSIAATKVIKYLNGKFKNKNSRIKGQSLADDARKLMDIENADDCILNCCLQLKFINNYNRIMLLSNDNNLRNKALVSDIETYSHYEFTHEVIKEKKDK